MLLGSLCKYPHVYRKFAYRKLTELHNASSQIFSFFFWLSIEVNGKKWYQRGICSEPAETEHFWDIFEINGNSYEMNA